MTDQDLPLLSVSGLNRLVAQAIAQKFPLVRLEAELSQVMQAASGHWYFTVKDAQASLRAVMFRKEASTLGFRPVEGMQVSLRVAPGLYEPKGEFQCRILAMSQAGLGSLYERFQRLKTALSAEGLFDPARKRPFPARVERIGLITSLGAAALRDVMVTITRHAPRLPVVLFPSLVQGNDAPPALLEALERAHDARVDVLLIVRGGGSLEDLWAFNDERVVRAIAAFPVYTISGIGHETDISLADLAADHRAATPTAAALWASQREQAVWQRLQALVHIQARAMQRRLTVAQQQRDRAELGLPNPRARLTVQKMRWARSASAFLALGQRRLDHVHARLTSVGGRLTALDPMAVLGRGYALVFDAAGSPVAAAQALRPEQPVTLTFSDGKARARVTEILAPADKPRES